MSTRGLRLLILFVWVFGLAAGCAAVPPAASHVAAATPKPLHDDDDVDDDGWLWRRLTGQNSASAEQNAPSPVVAASGAEPIDPRSGISSPVVPATGLPSTASTEPESQNDSSYELSDFSPDNIGGTLKKMSGYGPNEGVARALLQEGESLFRQKKYSEAAGRFRSAAARWPDSPLEEDAWFLEAESYFFSDKYPKAQDTYDKLLEKHKIPRHLDAICKRLFAIAQYWEQLHASSPHWPTTPNLTDASRPRFDTFGNAIKAYESVRMHDPIGPLADDAVMATANTYFRKGRYEDAAYHYDVVRKEYPRSEHQPRAHLLGIQSKLQMYQGHLYDGTPLKEADELAEQALSQFRRELGAEQQRVAQVRNDIVRRKAERDWAVAQYYDKKKQYGAARHYYQAILKDYPLTQFAPQAQARLEQIRGEPEEPPNRFKWLTNVFEPPEEKKGQAPDSPTPFEDSRAPLQWVSDLLRRHPYPAEEYIK